MDLPPRSIEASPPSTRFADVEIFGLSPRVWLEGQHASLRRKRACVWSAWILEFAYAVVVMVMRCWQRSHINEQKRWQCLWNWGVILHGDGTVQLKSGWCDCVGKMMCLWGAIDRIRPLWWSKFLPSCMGNINSAIFNYYHHIYRGLPYLRCFLCHSNVSRRFISSRILWNYLYWDINLSIDATEANGRYVLRQIDKYTWRIC